MAKEFREAREGGMQAIGQMWHRDMLPEHFTDRATRLYKYAERTAKYKKRKQKKFGHKTPLVFTGRMRDALMGLAQIRASSEKVRVSMSGPRWLSGFMSFRGRTGTGPDMKKEITTIRQDEGETLAMGLHRYIVQRLETMRPENKVISGADGYRIE